jgi:hypothetical protein
MTKLDELNRISPTRKAVVAAGIVLGLAVIAFLYWYAMQTRAHEYSDAADIYFFNSGQPMTIVCKVEDADKKPLAGVGVYVKSGSGGARGTTSADGQIEWKVNSPEVLAIELAGRKVLSRPYAVELGYPSAKTGMTITIVVKDSALLSKTP